MGSRFCERLLAKLVQGWRLVTRLCVNHVSQGTPAKKTLKKKNDATSVKDVLSSELLLISDF